MLPRVPRWMETPEAIPFSCYPDGPMGLGSIYRLPAKNGDPRVEPEYPLNTTILDCGTEFPTRTFENCLFRDNSARSLVGHAAGGLKVLPGASVSNKASFNQTHTQKNMIYAKSMTSRRLKLTQEYLAEVLDAKTAAGKHLAKHLKHRWFLPFGKKRASVLIVTGVIILDKNGVSVVDETRAKKFAADLGLNLNALGPHEPFLQVKADFSSLANHFTQVPLEYPALIAYCMSKVTMVDGGDFKVKNYNRGAMQSGDGGDNADDNDNDDYDDDDDYVDDCEYDDDDDEVFAEHDGSSGFVVQEASERLVAAWMGA